MNRIIETQGDRFPVDPVRFGDYPLSYHIEFTIFDCCLPSTTGGCGVSFEIHSVLEAVISGC